MNQNLIELYETIATWMDSKTADELFEVAAEMNYEPLRQIVMNYVMTTKNKE